MMCSKRLTRPEREREEEEKEEEGKGGGGGEEEEEEGEHGMIRAQRGTLADKPRRHVCPSDTEKKKRELVKKKIRQRKMTERCHPQSTPSCRHSTAECTASAMS